MYLTNSYLCFFAHMPSREVCIIFLIWRSMLMFGAPQDQILKSGSLSKKAQRTKRWIKHWFILKNDALSWYQSSSVIVRYIQFIDIMTWCYSRIPISLTVLLTCGTQYPVMRTVKRVFVSEQIKRLYFCQLIRFPAEMSGSRRSGKSFSRHRIWATA